MMLSLCLLRIRAILFFCNRVFRKGLSHANYSLSSRQTSEPHWSMKKWISQNEDNFLIKETKNVISFHAKKFTGAVKEQKKLEFLLPPALLQKSILVTCAGASHVVYRACCRMNWKIQEGPCNSLYCFSARRMLAHGQHGCHGWLLHWHRVSPHPLLYSTVVMEAQSKVLADIQLVTHLFPTVHLEV